MAGLSCEAKTESQQRKVRLEDQPKPHIKGDEGNMYSKLQYCNRILMNSLLSFDESSHPFIDCVLFPVCPQSYAWWMDTFKKTIAFVSKTTQSTETTETLSKQLGSDSSSPVGRAPCGNPKPSRQPAESPGEVLFKKRDLISKIIFFSGKKKRDLLAKTWVETPFQNSRCSEATSSVQADMHCHLEIYSTQISINLCW